MADLLVHSGRVDSAPKVFGSCRVCCSSPDRKLAGGKWFFVVLAADLELHHYQVSVYGEVFYFGSSPLIPDFLDAPPPYWADADRDQG